jgi:DnaJ-class molecular chaperone
MCEICNGYPYCPVCSDDVELEECEECNGTGVIFFECDGEELDERCSNCKGEGYIFSDYEPDPDERYDDRCINYEL